MCKGNKITSCNLSTLTSDPATNFKLFYLYRITSLFFYFIFIYFIVSLLFFDSLIFFHLIFSMFDDMCYESCMVKYIIGPGIDLTVFSLKPTVAMLVHLIPDLLYV